MLLPLLFTVAATGALSTLKDMLLAGEFDVYIHCSPDATCTAHNTLAAGLPLVYHLHTIPYTFTIPGQCALRVTCTPLLAPSSNSIVAAGVTESEAAKCSAAAWPDAISTETV